MINNAIQIFNNPEFGKVRIVVEDDGIVRYCGKDIATALGHSNSSKAISDHCKGITKRYPLMTAGGMQEFVFITEADVFRFTTSSRLPNAQRFEAWLFEDIAPKAVKGELVSVEDMWAKMSTPDGIIELATKWKNAQNRVLALEAENEVMRPKTQFADAVSTSSSTILIGDLAKLLRQNGVDIGPNRLFELLRQEGYLIRRKGTDYNTPSQRAMEMGLFRVKETAITHADGHVSITRTTKVTGKGQQYFINKFLSSALAVV
jgi:anti-repressor protein